MWRGWRRRRRRRNWSKVQEGREGVEGAGECVGIKKYTNEREGVWLGWKGG